jgi:phage/plasmid-associated DNA primase
MSEADELAADIAEMAENSPNLRKPLSEYLRSDWGNAELLRDRHGGEMFWVADGKSGDWYIWDGRRWRKDEDGLVNRWAKAAIDELIEDAQKRMAKAKDAPNPEEAVKQARQAYSYAIGCTNRARIRAMLETARTLDTGRTVPAGRFDTNRAMLATESCALELLDGGALAGPTARTDYIARNTGTPYIHGARSQKWDDYRKTFLPDKEMEHFLQRLIGYGMFGGNPRGLFVIFEGGPNSGKSTLLNMIGATFGEYTQAMDLTSLRGKFDAGPREDVAAIVRARFALASEMSGAWELHADQIKRFTGSDPVTFQHKYGAQQTVTPEFLPMVATNSAPRVRGADKALAVRICVVPFSHSVPEKNERGAAMTDDPAARAAFLA